MSDPALGLLMLTLIVVVIMMGFATAFTLMGLGMIFGFIAFYDPTQAWTHNQVFDLMVQRTYGAMTNDVLISIPLFVLMGYVMERGALVDKMFYSIQLAFRRVPAALAVATLIVCTFWGIASGLVGAVVVLMGVIAFNPMLRAGYDVQARLGRHHRRRHARHPDPALGDDHRLRRRRRAVGGQALRRGNVPGLLPVLPLPRLHHRLGADRSQDRAARCRRSRRACRCRAGCEKVQAAYSRNLLVALPRARWSSPAQGGRHRRRGQARWATAQLLLEPCVTALVPLLLAVASRMWRPVVVRRHPPAGGARRAEVAGVQQLGTPGIATAPATEAELGPPPAFYHVVLPRSRVLLALMLRALLLAHGRRALRRAEAADRLGDAARHPDGGRAGGDPVRHHDGHRIGRGRRAGAFLLAFQARTLDWKRTKEAVFLTAKTTAMVCWLFVGSALFSAVFAILGGQALVERWALSLDMTPLQFMLLSQAIIFVLGWPLEWTEIIIIFVPIFLPLLKHFNIDPILWGTHGVRESAGGVPVAAGGDVGVLSQGRVAAKRRSGGTP